MKDPLFTLAICTYNRAESLRRTLESLKKAFARCEPGQWEILLIDNQSTDNTPDVARDYARCLPLRYLFEPKQGLSHGRNRALDEFRGRFLVFTDDDVSVGEDWLSAYSRALTAFPTSDYFGGRIKPLWRTERRPAWLKDETLSLIAGLLVLYDLGETDRPLGVQDPSPFGANFGISRRLSDSIGRFRPDLGVKANVPGRGEEADYLRRAREQGFEGMYLASALCHHEVDTRRLSLVYLYRYGIQKGIAEVRNRKANSSKRASQEFTYAVRGLWQLVRGRGDRFRQCVINMGIERGLRRQ